MDMLEIIGLGEHPWDAIRKTFKKSTKVYALETKEKKLIALFGVGETRAENIGCVWMLGTDRLKTIKKSFIKNSKEWVEVLMGDNRCLINVVSLTNKLSMRWLKWLGAEFLREQPNGYLEFIIPKIN